MRLLKKTISSPTLRANIHRVFGRYLYWKWSARIGKKRILADHIPPLQLVVKEEFPASIRDYVFGLHAESEMGFMMHFLRKDDFFVDIGANIGTYSLLAAAVSEAFVLSFEPDDARREFFKDQVTVNALAPLIFIDGRVVSTKEETLIFSEQSVSKNIYVEAGVPRIAVSMDSLELDKTPIMVKIDAKGYDLEVIQGMRELLEHDELKVVLCDFSEDIEEEVKNLVREIIRSKGFKVCAYDPKQRSLEEVPVQDKQLMLFVRDQEFVEQRLLLAKTFKWYNKEL